MCSNAPQVYRGELRPEWGGGQVAVKVQRPGVLEAVALDIYIMRRAAEIFSKLPGVRRARVPAKSLLRTGMQGDGREARGQGQVHRGQGCGHILIPAHDPTVLAGRHCMVAVVDGG